MLAVLLLLLSLFVTAAAAAVDVDAVTVAVATEGEEAGEDMTTVSSTGITMLSRLHTTSNKQTNKTIS